jgi:Domain of unknown function (DUF4956)/MgtC family
VQAQSHSVVLSCGSGFAQQAEMRLRLATSLLTAVLVLLTLATASAQPELTQPRSSKGDILSDAPDAWTQLAQLRHAAIRLPVAAGLASILAFRPRRRGTPRRQPAVIQTQIILAIVGAVVMLVVGSSLARAFGIVGAAGLVRYRAKVEDTKDAGVMLSTLAVGLASGVGLWMLALFSTVFFLAVLWIIESLEPRATQFFTLKIKSSDPTALKPHVEQLLSRYRVPYEVRSMSKEELQYEVSWPIDRKTDRASEALVALGGEDTAVEWEEKKAAKK